MRYFIVFFILGLTQVSCSYFTTSDDKVVNAVARVNSSYLLQSDVQSVVPKGSSAADSANLVQAYIESWIKERLVLQQARLNFNADSLDAAIEKQIQEYKTSLITYVYEKALVEQKLDTLVSDSEILKYYNDNQRNFILKDNILKVIYIKVSRKAPNIDKLKYWYKSDQPKDRELLEAYCKQYAQNYFLDENSWLLFDDLLKEVPIPAYNKELFLQYNRFVEVADSASLFFVNIKGFKVKDGVSPLAFEKENIRNIILNKRKIQLISSMKDEIFNKAINSKEAEVY